MKKTSAEQVLRLLERGHNDPKDLDPFVISGSKVLEGVGTCKSRLIGLLELFTDYSRSHHISWCQLQLRSYPHGHAPRHGTYPSTGQA
jgi:hypothetical protein